MHQPIEEDDFNLYPAKTATQDYIARTVVRVVVTAAILLPFLTLAKHAGVLS